MKTQTTKKSIVNNFNTYSISYCAAQYLFRYLNAEHFTCGVYGWNSDIYTFGNIAISTGYRPFGKQLNYDLVNQFENAARKIAYSDMDESQKKQKTIDLVVEFINTIKSM